MKSDDSTEDTGKKAPVAKGMIVDREELLSILRDMEDDLILTSFSPSDSYDSLTRYRDRLADLIEPAGRGPSRYR